MIHEKGKMNREDYSASKVRKQPDNLHAPTHFKIIEMISRKEMIDYDFAYKSTQMSFYDDKYSASIPAGSLLPGFTYVLEVCSLINNEIGAGRSDKFFHKETFKFKVTE